MQNLSYKTSYAEHPPISDVRMEEAKGRTNHYALRNNEDIEVGDPPQILSHHKSQVYCMNEAL